MSSPPPQPVAGSTRAGRRRALTRLLVVAAFLAGLVLVAAGSWLFARDSLTRWWLSDDVPPGLASTAAPSRADAVPGTAAPSSSPSPSEPGAPGTATAQPVRPAHLFAPDLEINAPVAAAGTTTYDNPFTGTRTSAFGVPDNPYTTTWWSDGPQPGDEGLAILLGHSEIGRKGVFDHVATAPVGTLIGVRGEDGRVLRFRVTEVRTGIPKREPEALTEVLENPPPGRVIALVTCSGSITAELSSHDDNAVAFAVLDGELPAGS